MRIHTLAAALALGILSVSQAAVQSTFYVSPTGTGDYSQSSPGSLSGVQAKVRTVNTNMTGDIIIYLRGGTYALDSALNLNSSDKATNGYRIKWMNYTGEKPILDGGQTITGWSQYSGDIYRASYTGGPALNMWVNDTTATLAMCLNCTASSSWSNQDQIFAIPSSGWCEPLARVASISGTTVTYQGGDAKYVSSTGPLIHFSNSLSFVDSARDFFVDTVGHYAYYQVPSGQTMSGKTVVVPKRFECLVKILGSSNTNRVTGITFYGIGFRHSNFLYARYNGYWDSEFRIATGTGNTYTFADNTGAISVENASGLVFERCNLEYVSGAAIFLRKAVRDCKLIGNVVRECGGTGIVLGFMDPSFEDGTEDGSGPNYNPSDTNELVTNDTISNCYIRNTGNLYHSSSGIFGAFNRNIRIVHNDIGYTSYSGIVMGVNCLVTLPTKTGGHFIGYNKVWNAQRWSTLHNSETLNDGGGIYTVSAQPGIVITDNYLKYDGTNAGYGSILYNDQGSNGVVLKRNVIDDHCNNWLSWWMPLIQDCSCDSTYRVSSTGGYTNAGTNCTVTNVFNNINLTDAVPQAIINASGIESAYQDITGVMVTRADHQTDHQTDHLCNFSTGRTDGRASVVVTLSQAQPVRLRVYSLDGRLVGTLYSGELGPGQHRFDLGKSIGQRTVLIAKLDTGTRTTAIRLIQGGHPTRTVDNADHQ